MKRLTTILSIGLLLGSLGLPGTAGAQAPAPAAAPAAPSTGVAPVELKDVKEINSGDTAWMLTSAALVLMMTGPGLALFYGGLVRRKNVLATMMQSFACMAVVSIAWAIIGYSLAFDVGNSFIGGLRFAFLRDVIVGLRVSDSDEVEGLDLSQHGESGYIMGEGDSSVSAVSHVVAPSPKMSPSPARVPGRA
jgi:Amt family ammonium transporter